MKIKVIKGFIDKMTGEEINTGEVVEREEQRAKEIVGAGFAEEIKEEIEEEEQEEKQEGEEKKTERTPTRRRAGTK